MDPQALLSVKELSSRLGINTSTLYRLVETKGIPFLKGRGLGLKFRSSEVDKWLEDQSSKPHLRSYQEETFLKALLTAPVQGARNASGGTGEMAKAKTLTRLNLGIGYVYPRKTRSGIIRWYLDYRDAKGKRVLRVAPHATSREEAALELKAAVLLEHERACGISGSSQRIKFSEFSQMYLDNYAKVNKRSWRDDKYRLDASMVPYFGKLELQDITPLEIEKYRARRLEEKVSKSTVNREITILKKMFNLAIDWNFAKQNPVLKIKLFSEKNTMKERILLDEEEGKLLAECPGYLKPILIAALNTGMRRGEILNLEWAQVDLAKRTILVKNTKSGKDRLLPINETLYSALSRLRSHDRKGTWVFPNPATGKPFTEVKKSFKEACKRAGITDLRFHDLRHTFASRLVIAGADIITLRDLLGHFSVRVTQRYTHPGQSQKVKAVELLDRKKAQEPEDLLHSCYTN